MTMRLPKPLLAAALALPLAACLSFGAEPPAQLLSLQSDQLIQPGQPRTAGDGQTITIAVPSVPQALATTRLPVNSGPNAIAYIKEAAWAENPNRLFQRLLAEKVAAVTGRVVLDPRQSNLDPGLRITGQLLRFGLDAPGYQAVAIYDAVLTRGERVETRRFEARVPVGVAQGGAAAVGLNAAANQIAGEVAAWIGS